MRELWKKLKAAIINPPSTQDKTGYLSRKYQNKYLIIEGLISNIFPIIATLSRGEIYLPTLATLVLSWICLLTKSYNSLLLVYSLEYIFCLMSQTQFKDISISIPLMIFINTLRTYLNTRSFKLTFIMIILHAYLQNLLMVNEFKAHLLQLTVQQITDQFSASVKHAYALGFLLIVRLKVFNKQFTSTISKISKLKNNLEEANLKLREQNFQLQQAFEMKDVLILNFSHELKNALNSLLGNIHLASNEAHGGGQTATHLHAASVNAGSVKNFVQNIIDIGLLLNQTPLEVNRKPTDLPSLLQRIWYISREIIRNKRLDGTFSLSSRIPRHVCIDKERILQAVLNLVLNAVKFTDKGYVKINVNWVKPELEDEHLSTTKVRALNRTLVKNCSERKSERLSGLHDKFEESNKKDQLIQSWKIDENYKGDGDEEGKLVIQITDSGCGINEDDIATLGTGFKQTTNTNGPRGIGIGLWITKELLKSLNASIDIQSAVDIGTTCNITIPCAVSTGELIDLIDREGSWRATEKNKGIRFSRPLSSSLEKNNVLIVDDDVFNLELMQKFLSKIGVSFFVAHDGREAVSVFEAQHKTIGLIITDNYMPKMSGTQAAQEIQNIIIRKELEKVPIFCVSADETTRLRKECEEAGIVELVPKPLDFEYFRALVARFIVTKEHFLLS